MPDELTGPKRTAEGEPQPLEPAPPKIPAIAAKANDLEAIRTAVTDAAGVSAGLWLSYLFVLFYLLIAAGGVTHKDLFLENPVKLPFLNVDLPLKGFFWLGPALFLIVHAYVLLHFIMLASKVRVFDAQLRAQIPEDSEVRTGLRRQLPSNIFVQFLAGPRELRDGVVGFLLWLIALISLVIGPVALLVFFELQFLPYHDQWITWWQRIAIVLDLALLWTLWPRVGLPARISQEIREARPRRGLVEVTQRTATIAGMVLISVISVPLVFAIATFPGEWLEEKMASVQPIAPLRAVLVAGTVDFATRKPTSLWSNRLVLQGLDVIDHTKLDSEPKMAALRDTASIRARHLEGAVLIGAGLRKVDFTGARLEHASLAESDLREASFVRANLQGADLRFAELQGASFDDAQLQGAELSSANLQGASLENAQLQGASLAYAQLQGATLGEAQLQGASLDHAQLQGAFLDLAELQGANLENAQLQGAFLNLAQLQGATPDNAQLQSASLVMTFVWRADARTADTADARVTSIERGPKPSLPSMRFSDWSSQSFSDLKQRIEQEVPEGSFRRNALARIEQRLDPELALDGEDQIAEYWRAVDRPLTPELYIAPLAKIWWQIGCSKDGAPYVLAGLITTMSRLQPPPNTPLPGALVPQPVNSIASGFLRDECAGARVLPDQAKASLESLRDRAAYATSRNAQPTTHINSQLDHE